LWGKLKAESDSLALDMMRQATTILPF